MQLMLLRQGQCGTTQIVGPIVLLLGWYRGDMPLCTLCKLQRGHLNNAILLRGVCYMDALIYSQTSNLTQVMVRMGSNRTDTVRTEGHAFCIATINLIEFLLTVHYLLR